jgi:hypothetical protein
MLGPHIAISVALSALKEARTIGRNLSETFREAFGQAIRRKSLQDEIEKKRVSAGSSVRVA